MDGVAKHQYRPRMRWIAVIMVGLVPCTSLARSSAPAHRCNSGAAGTKLGFALKAVPREVKPDTAGRVTVTYFYLQRRSAIMECSKPAWGDVEAIQLWPQQEGCDLVAQ